MQILFRLVAFSLFVCQVLWAANCSLDEDPLLVKVQVLRSIFLEPNVFAKRFPGERYSHTNADGKLGGDLIETTISINFVADNGAVVWGYYDPTKAGLVKQVLAAVFREEPQYLAIPVPDYLGYFVESDFCDKETPEGVFAISYGIYNQTNLRFNLLKAIKAALRKTRSVEDNSARSDANSVAAVNAAFENFQKFLITLDPEQRAATAGKAISDTREALKAMGI